MKGQHVCPMHGGKAPKALEAARVRIADEEAARMLERLEGSPITDVADLYQHLGRTAGRVLALVDISAERVAALREWTKFDAFSREEARADLLMYERALDRCTRFLTAVARVDLEARIDLIDEARAEIVVRVIERVLEASGLDPDSAEVRTRVAHELTVAAG